MDVERLVARMADLVARLVSLKTDGARLAEMLEVEPPHSPVDFDPLHALARRLSGAPSLANAALASPAWQECVEKIEHLLGAGRTLTHAADELSVRVSPTAWSTDATPIVEALSILPADFSPESFKQVSALCHRLPDLLAEAKRLADALAITPPENAASIDRLVRIGDRVATAPEASPDVFAAEIWTDGAERAADLADAVMRLDAVRTEVSGRLSDAAWTADLASARTTLAAHGSSLLRYLSGEWRRADKLVRSVLSAPTLPLTELLPLLDALGRGQAALREVRAGDELGRQAFGSHWRSERRAGECL